MTHPKFKDERKDTIEAEMASPALQRQNEARKLIESRTFDMEVAASDQDYFDNLFREIDA